jgi:hypothetical protein
MTKTFTEVTVTADNSDEYFIRTGSFYGEVEIGLKWDRSRSVTIPTAVLAELVKSIGMLEYEVPQRKEKTK